MLLPVQLDPYMVVDHLQKNATYEEALDFIIAIDEIMADWDFTKMLIAYAKEQEEAYAEESSE